MARHRRRRRDRPTITVPGSTPAPVRPIATTAMIAVGLLATPGLTQIGTGDSGPLEGSAQLRPPTNALGVPRLNDYDSEGRLTLEAVPDAISTVAITQLPSEPVQISPAVAAAVAETIKQQEPSPLAAAMAFGPDDVETVRIDDLGVPVVDRSSGADSADLLLGEVVPELGDTEEAGAEAEVGGSSGLALGGDPEGAGTEGSGAGSVLDLPVAGDSPEGPSAGGYAPDAPEGSGSSTSCPDEEPLPSSSWDEGQVSQSGPELEGANEVTSGTGGDRDVRPVPVVEVEDSSSGAVEGDTSDGDLPGDVGPDLDTPVDNVVVHVPDRPTGDGASDPDVDSGGRGSDSPKPRPAKPSVPSVPDEVNDDDEPVVDRPVPSTPADPGDSVPELPDPVGGGGDSGGSDPEPDRKPEPVEEPVAEPEPVEEEPAEPVEVEVPDEEPEPVEEPSEPAKDKDKDKDKEDDAPTDPAGEDDRSDSGESADEESEGSSDADSTGDDSEDAPESETRDGDDGSDSDDERKHSGSGSKTADSDSDRGDRGDDVDDSSDDGGENNSSGDES